MAEQAVTAATLADSITTTYTWSGITNSDTAAALVMPRTKGAVAAIQITGTPDSATVILQGSNDGTNWASLTDVNNDAISLTASTSVVDFSTAAAQIRPSVSGGGGSQDLNVIVVARG